MLPDKPEIKVNYDFIGKIAASLAIRQLILGACGENIISGPQSMTLLIVVCPQGTLLARMDTDACNHLANSMIIV